MVVKSTSEIIKKSHNNIVSVRKSLKDISLDITKLNTSDSNLDTKIHSLKNRILKNFEVIVTLYRNIYGYYYNFNNSSYLKKYDITSLKDTNISKLNEILSEENNRNIKSKKLNYDNQDNITKRNLYKILGLLMIAIVLFIM